MKTKGKGKKRERKRTTEIDSHARKTKKLFNYIRLVGKYDLFGAKLIFGYSHANKTKPVQKGGIKEKCDFSLIAGRHRKINVRKSLIMHKKQILTDFTNLRKSCDLASARSRSVSIPSGCRGNPESNEAIARITVASSSLHIKTKMHVISRVRARCNQ